MKKSVEELRERLDSIAGLVEDAATRSGRSANEVRILPVTKTFPAEVVRDLAAAGVGAVGENRVGEIKAKRDALAGLDLEWVLIGHLQRNKVRAAVQLVDEIQSIDSVRLATALSKALPREIPVLLEVNTSGEVEKSGFSAPQLEEQLPLLASLPNLAIKGLMTVASRERAQARACFAQLRQLRDAVATPELPLPELSMGMSGDFEVAIEEGSTCVRLGQILLGERSAT